MKQTLRIHQKSNIKVTTPISAFKFKKFEPVTTPISAFKFKKFEPANDNIPGNIVTKAFGREEKEEDDMIISGLCSLSIVDHQKHLILPEAYEKIFEQSLENVKVVYNHNYTSPLLGRILELSLVTIDVKPPKLFDSNRKPHKTYGLYVKIKFHNTEEGRLTYRQYKSQAVPSFSIGFEALDYDTICATKLINDKKYSQYIRTFNEKTSPNQNDVIWVISNINLIEVSLVSVPANSYCHTLSYAETLDLFKPESIEYVDERNFCYRDPQINNNEGGKHGNERGGEGDIQTSTKKNNNKKGVTGLEGKKNNAESKPKNIVRAYLGDETVDDLGHINSCLNEKDGKDGKDGTQLNSQDFQSYCQSSDKLSKKHSTKAKCFLFSKLFPKLHKLNQKLNQKIYGSKFK